MAKESSVAPKERINIRYVPATLGQQAEVELPLRITVLGDFLGREDSTPLEDRRALSVDKNNFASVMEEAGLHREFTVPNELASNEQSGEPENDLKVSLDFKSLKDFGPDSVVRQVPELKKLIELREALVALKGPLGNMPAFRRRLEQLLNDEKSREKLLNELKSIDTNGLSVGDNKTGQASE